MKNNYIIRTDNYNIYEDYTLEDIEKIIKQEQEKNLKWYKEQLEKSKKEIEYFKNKEYDKISILDRPYFLDRGQQGLDDLEKAIHREIEYFSNLVEEYKDTKPYRIFKEIKEETPLITDILNYTNTTNTTENLEILINTLTTILEEKRKEENK